VLFIYFHRGLLCVAVCTTWSSYKHHLLWDVIIVSVWPPLLVLDLLYLSYYVGFGQNRDTTATNSSPFFHLAPSALYCIQTLGCCWLIWTWKSCLSLSLIFVEWNSGLSHNHLLVSKINNAGSWELNCMLLSRAYQYMWWCYIIGGISTLVLSLRGIATFI